MQWLADQKIHPPHTAKKRTKESIDLYTDKLMWRETPETSNENENPRGYYLKVVSGQTFATCANY